MDIQRLVYMANQIGKAFRLEGEAAETDAVEDHLRKFWDPRMRSQIVAHLAAGGDGLDPAVREAVAKLG